MKKKINIDVKQKRQLLKLLNINSVEEIDKTVLKKLKEDLKELTDSRQKGKKIYKIWDIVMCVILASFSNCYTWDDVVDFVKSKYSFIRQFLKMTGGIPSPITYERVFSIIDSSELEKILTSFLLNVTRVKSFENDIISFDGRIDKGSSRKLSSIDKENIIPLNCLNAYSTKYSLCIASEKIGEKSNEIPALPLLIERINVTGATLVWDALNSQKDTIEAAVNAGADYVAALKGNQGTFFEDVKKYFDEKRREIIIAGNSKSQYKVVYEKSHSCCIKYEYFQTTDIDWYYDKDGWMGFKSIGLVKKTIETMEVVTIEKKEGKKKIKEKVKQPKIIIEERFYFSSLDLDIDFFAKAKRNEWHIENKLHWHLDVTFREDKNTTANKNALFNLQLVNKFVLGILEKVKQFYNNISLRRIINNISLNYENEFINIICYLLLSQYKTPA